MLTIKDIAKKSGVSYSTVSKVLNNYPDIGEETRKKVMAVVNEFNFTPNISARKLVQKSSNIIGFIMSGLEASDTNDVAPLQILKGALSYIHKTNYDIIFYPITSEIQKQKSYSQFCRENNITGVVLSGLRTDDPYYVDASNSDLPCVTIDFALPGKQNSCISIDNVEAARSAVEFLVRSGHKHIGTVNGKAKSVVGLERCAGYCQALLDGNLPIINEYVIDGEFNEEIAYEKSLVLLTRYPEITALFCASDVMAMGVYRAAKKLGRKIPQDLSVVGFDDLPLASYAAPPLTTIRQNFFQFGEYSIKLLIDILGQKTAFSHQVYVDYNLILRDSTTFHKG